MPFRTTMIKRDKSEAGTIRETVVAIGGKHRNEANKLSMLLWMVQGLLAVLFLFAGGMKLLLPLAALTQQTQLPGVFLRFIGVAEVLGAIGLIVPGLLRIRPGLTPIAAAGLLLIMIGATVLTATGGDIRMALIPLLTGPSRLSLLMGAGGSCRIVRHLSREYFSSAADCGSDADLASRGA